MPRHHCSVSCVAPPSGVRVVSIDANALARTLPQPSTAATFAPPVPRSMARYQPSSCGIVIPPLPASTGHGKPLARSHPRRTTRMRSYPYADRYPVLRGMPSVGRAPDEILRELCEMAALEDRSWEEGKASGSFYCGDKEHYAFMAKAFEMYGHMNALQRDVCPSSTRFEGEIIAMTLDLMHADAARDRGHDPVGLISSGGSGSILHAVLSYREQARQEREIAQPNIVKPETG